MQELTNVFPRHYKELKSSFIDDELIRLNIKSFEGMAAQEEYFRNYDGDRLNTGAPARRQLGMTNFLLAGCWVAYTHTQDGLRPHFKPDKPIRSVNEEGKVKVIKYTQIKGSKNGYFMPKLTYHHVELIAKRYKLKKYPKGEPNLYCEESWDWIAKEKKMTIAITEGSKKTLALNSAGIPCIGITGIQNFENFGKEKRKAEEEKTGQALPDNNLLDCFRKLEGHNFDIYFDMDSKIQTIKNVSMAAERLTKALLVTKISKVISRKYWDGKKGKGIDDYLFNTNGDLSELSSVQIIIGEKYKSVEADLTVHERYLTDEKGQGLAILKEAINNHKIILIESAKNTGKTSFLSNYTYAFQIGGVKVFIPTHRRTLMAELSNRMNTANAENLRGSKDKVFGLSMCLDSMHSKSAVAFTPEMLEEYRGCILVIDEVDQVLDHLAEGATEIKANRKTVNQNLVQLMKISQKVIASSADISQEVADFLTTNCGEKPFVIRNTFKPKGGKCTIYTQTRPYKFLTKLEEAIARGEKVMVFTTGQKEISTWSTTNLEQYFKARFPGLKIGSVDASTAYDKERIEFRCYEDYNAFIEREQFDILLVSPVVSTGTDITSKHFDSYWGVNWGVISVNSFSQAMGRIRDNIPRHIWTSNSFLGFKGNGKCFGYQLEYSQKNQLETNKLIFMYFDTEYNPYLNEALLKYWAVRSAIVNTQGQQLQLSTITKFEDDYEFVDFDEKDLEDEEKKGSEENLKSVKEANVYIYYDNIIASPLLEDDELGELRKQQEKTATERYTERANNTIRKISPRDKKVKLTHEILEAEDAGCFQKMELDWLGGKGLSITHKQDKQRSLDGDFILDTNNKCKATKANYIKKFGLQAFTKNNPGELYTNQHPLVKEVAANIRKGFNKIKGTNTTIRDYWRVSPKLKDWNLVKWALGLIGYTFYQVDRKENIRIYMLSDCYRPEFRAMIFKFWDEEKLDLILSDKLAKAENPGLTNSPDAVIASDTTPSSNPDKFAYIYYVKDKTLNMSEPLESLDNVVTPPEINKGDFTYFLDDIKSTIQDLEDVAEIIEIINPDKSPLENFLDNIQGWGWDVFKEVAKYSQLVRDKTLKFSAELINLGQWDYVSAYETPF